MKNKFGNRYTRAIATFHFHKFVQMFRRTFSLTLSFILFSCVRSGKQENTTRKRKHRPSFTELCNGQHGSATEQNHHLKRAQLRNPHRGKQFPLLCEKENINTPVLQQSIKQENFQSSCLESKGHLPNTPWNLP